MTPIARCTRIDLDDTPMTSYVRTVVQRHNAWLESLLRALPVGGTLCVHELPTEFGDPYTATIRAEAHVLGPDGCDAAVVRAQYGPKPAWPAPRRRSKGTAASTAACASGRSTRKAPTTATSGAPATASTARTAATARPACTPTTPEETR